MNGLKIFKEIRKMEMTESKKDNVVILRLTGKLDASTSNSLEEKLVSLLDHDEKQFVVDLAHLTYISSAGLRVLLMAAKRLKNVKIVLCLLQENFRDIYYIAVFTAIFSIYHSEEAALKDF
jgi:anti-sigma B factor antagonist